MQNNMQIWLESSTTTFNLNSHDEGVYLVSDLDGLTSLPEIRTSQGVNAGTDGGWTSAQAFDARLISLNIVIANEDESIVESKRRTLNSLLAQSRKEALKLHFISEAGMEYVISVRVTNVSGALSNILKKQNLLIQMRADDPIIYGAQGGEGADATLTVQQAQGGFEIPFDIPLIISGGTDKVNVENLGSEEVYPVIKMTGPLHNPTVVNETQNAEIGVNADLGDMEWRGYESAEIHGNATQETLSGKNILNINGTIDTQNASVSISGDSITITSTANAELSRASIIFSYDANREMTISFDAEVIENNATDTINNVVFRTIGASDTISVASLSNTVGLKQHFVKAITSDNNTRSLWLYIKAQNNAGVRSVKFSNIQVEYGPTATDYEQYCGGIPSPNPDYPQDVNVVSGLQTVKITGKNIFDINSLANGTITVSDGVATGTASQFANGFGQNTSGIPLPSVPSQVSIRATAYTDGNSGTTGNGLSLRAVFTDGSEGTLMRWSNDTTTATELTVTTVANKTLAKIYFFYNNIGANIWHLSNVQIEIGNQVSEFEQYQAQSYEINLGGTNLLPSTGTTQTGGTGVSITRNNDGTYTVNGTASSGGYLEIGTIDFKQGQTYTISGLTGWTATTLQLFTMSDTAFPLGHRLASYNGPTTQTALGDETCVIRLYVYQGTTYNNVVVKPQVQLGSQATPYAPYTTYQYELAKIDTYQDCIYKSGDKWYKHAEVGKVVLDGSESWTSFDTHSGSHITANVRVGDIVKTKSVIPFCDNFTGATLSQTWGGTIAFGVANYVGTSINPYLQFSMTSGFVADIGAWKTWLSTHNTTVYYALATPTDTEITDAELVGQLEALLDYAPWYGEDQNVFLIPSAGAQGELILGAHNEPKPADVVLIDTQLKTVTLNGQNAYPLLKDGSSFFTLAPGDNTMYLTSDVSSDTGKAEIKFKQGFISI